MPIFDDYASIAHESTLGIFGEPVIFIASDNRYSPIETYAVVSKRQSNYDQDGFKIINEAMAVRVDTTDQDFRIDDLVEFVETSKKYRIIDEQKDVNVTSKFILQEI